MSKASLTVRLGLPLVILMSMTRPGAAAPADYDFQIVGQPHATATGTTITVRLTRIADGPVTDAHVYYQSSQPLNPNAWAASGPRTLMQSDGQGNYTVVVHEQPTNGDPLHFVAEIPAHTAIASASKSGMTPAAVATEPGETLKWSFRLRKS